MKRTPKKTALLAALLAFTGTQCAPSSSSSPGTVADPCVGDRPGSPCFVTRVMCLGDSHTQGGGDLASYRYPLWFALQDSDRLVDFVGTQFTIEGENGTTNPDLTANPNYYTTFDRDHEGYSGLRTDEVLPMVASNVASQYPDVCLILLGTNDVGQGGAVGVQNALINIKQIVDEVRGQAPATMFAISNIPAIGPGSWYFQNEHHVPLFNADLATNIALWSTPGSPAILVDTHSQVVQPDDFRSDGLHFNFSGQSKVARAMHDALVLTLDGGLLPPTNFAASLVEGSFETLGLTDTEYSDIPLMDWVYPTSANLLAGAFNPGSDSYTGADGTGAPTGGEGDEVLSLESSGGDTSLGWAYQLTSTTLEPGMAYNLEVAVGQRLPGNSRGTIAYGGYELQLLAGNRVIAASSNQVTPIPGTLATDLLVVATDDLEDAPLGSPISIRMRMTWSDPGAATDFDWVRLTVH